jgi:hypothetical protein
MVIPGFYFDIPFNISTGERPGVLPGKIKVQYKGKLPVDSDDDGKSQNLLRSYAKAVFIQFWNDSNPKNKIYDIPTVLGQVSKLFTDKEANK